MGKQKNEKDWEEGRKGWMVKLPVPQNGSLLPRPLREAKSTTQTAKGNQILEGIKAIGV